MESQNIRRTLSLFILTSIAYYSTNLLSSNRTFFGPDLPKQTTRTYICGNESAKYWLGVLNEIKNRGVEDILIISVDGLTGFVDAIAAVFPTDDALFKSIYLAMIDITKKWTGKA